MRSLREIFVVGHGPSSSHTMGPAFACDYILKKYKNPQRIDVVLYDSLALTGPGHLTDYIIDLKLKKYVHTIFFDFDHHFDHPNTMDFYVRREDGVEERETIVSIGGGTIITKDSNINNIGKDIFPHQHLKDICAYCKKEGISLYDYVIKYEGEDVLDYLATIYDTMEAARSRGIKASGELPGSLHVQRKARTMYLAMRNVKDGKTNIHMNAAISAFAVAEENAAGGIVAIAPTCGSAGVIPGCITYLRMKNFSRKDIIKGLAIAGLIGIIAKTNASVSGAECGCQAEIGVACAMGAAMVSFVRGQGDDNVVQAAEIAMEHSLGLTCDPVDGYVQIPCIERCAMFALKAINASTLAKLIPASEAKVDFDLSLQTMYQTGKDLNEGYRETSVNGLAKFVKENSLKARDK